MLTIFVLLKLYNVNGYLFITKTLVIYRHVLLIIIIIKVYLKYGRIWQVNECNECLWGKCSCCPKLRSIVLESVIS